MKGLRKILGMQHPYVNRGNTNKRVLFEANRHLREEVRAKNAERRAKAKAEGKKCKSIPFTPIVLVGTDLLKTRIRYFGHIIRCHNEDPLKKCTLKKHRIRGNYHRKKRVGRPRVAWVQATSKACWTKLKPYFRRTGRHALAAQRFDSDDATHRKAIADAARARIF